ncbi:hypothetical protein AMECASPLE_019217 [Ameca splendens]|uniref:Uncharacterized protein n=1 Tax=Ameca splendens TaxID=208324 RepID=A0ABV0XRT7_9TELE
MNDDQNRNSVEMLLNLQSSLKSFLGSNWFPLRVTLYLAPSIFPSKLISLSIPAEEKHYHSMMLPPPCFTGEMGCPVLICSVGRMVREVKSISETVEELQPKVASRGHQVSITTMRC